MKFCGWTALLLFANSMAMVVVGAAVLGRLGWLVSGLSLGGAAMAAIAAVLLLPPRSLVTSSGGGPDIMVPIDSDGDGDIDFFI